MGDNGCWLWTTGISRGYGQVWYNGSMTTAHRAIYHIIYGLWSTRQNQIDHICRVRNCVNPNHLELVTAKENVTRSLPYWKPKVRPTHCVNGHQYTEENTKYYGDQGRKCYECKKIQDKKYNQTYKDKVNEHKRAWQKRNYEKIRIKNREYYDKNIEKIKKYHRQRYLRLKEDK